MKPTKYPRDEQGFHEVKCPSCGSDAIESTCMVVTKKDHDPNTKYCIDCEYSWRMVI